ncbi:glycoside hydrolase family 65 protein [Neobacillus soli]|uniref:glycoside hydrolase family 65 protein n=1 Tax=Neobacillus soli TaxID=220688 RepID=UPI000A7E57BE|nr:glycoside hydrolase family 65 protein [Neobacillus soli]
MQIKRLFDINPWKITTTNLNKDDKRLQESITSIGNGYMGMRGMFEEIYSGDNHQGIYLGGVWFPDKTRVGWWKNGYPQYFGKVINTVNFISMNIAIDDQVVDLYTEETVQDFTLDLDMRKGILERSFTIERNHKKVRFTFERFVSLATKELCAIRMTVTNLGEEAKITVTSSLDGNVKNEDSNYGEQFWELVQQSAGETGGFLMVRTIENPFEVPRFTVGFEMNHLFSQFQAVHSDKAEMKVSNHFEVNLGKNETAQLEKRVVVTTSRDYPTEAEIMDSANQITTKVKEKSFEELKNEQAHVWEERWHQADVEIYGDAAAQQGIRFNLFQLFSTYYGEDSRLNIGPKGFTGEKYGGATYWDTEAYAVPLYLALADPSVTKNLLLYRRNQLQEAKHNARQQGLQGALYPMVTFTGVECHNEWEITFEEIHRNGAIAYAIYNYTNYTGDDYYLKNEGIHVLVEISRFWADRVHYANSKNAYMIHGVTGPNEYENNVNNNWYTNKMAVWTLQYTLQSLNLVSEEKKQELHVTEAELNKWNDIVEKMYFPYDTDREVFVQHDTFLDKDIRPVSSLPAEDLPLNQNWSWDKILRSPFIKQADVLQGIYFFGNEFSLEEKQRNFDFYEPLTVHESSLSPCVHAILAAELRNEHKAVEMYERSSRLDLDNYNNDTEDGLHITSMTGSWLAIVQGFAGMRTFDGQLSFAPFIPEKWDGYSFHISYRGRLIYVEAAKNTVRLTLKQGDSIDLNLYEEKITLSSTYSKNI